MNWTGLAARAWDPSGGDGWNFDYPFIGDLITRYGQPALDLGCGTGRLLLRFLRDGFDVDGVDTSADMLAICQEKAVRLGLAPRLYHQSIQTLDLERTYKLIFIPCGTFMLITDREEAWAALRRCYAQLEPQGVLVFNLFWPFKDGEPLAPNAPGADGEWGHLWTHTLPDGQKIAQYLRHQSLNRVEQVLTAQRRYQLIDGDQIVQEEIFNINERWYFKYEVLLMLEQLNFRNIQIRDGWSDEEFAEKHSSMVLIAQK